MIMCLRCDNETRTTAVVTEAGEALAVAGTISRDPQPLSANVCVACGFVQLFAPQPIGDTIAEERAEEAPQPVTIGDLVGA